MKSLRFNVNIPQVLALKLLQKMRRDIYYNGFLSTVKLVETPEPEPPTPQWVKIKTRLCGFCASDLNLIHVSDNPSSAPFTSMPMTLGHEIMGEIVEVGADAGGLSVGDRVAVSGVLNCTAREIHPVCPACAKGRISSCENFAAGNLSPGIFNYLCTDVGGGFAPFCVAHKSQVFQLPDNVSDKAGAMIEPLAVALQAVLDTPPDAGDEVLVIGGGVIGNLVVQAIRALEIDCRITVADPSPSAAERARKAGAEHLITDGDLFGRAVEITGARRYKPPLGDNILMGGFNKVFDAVGTSKTVNAGLRLSAANGRINILAFKDIKLDVTPIFLKSQAVNASFAYHYNNTGKETEHVFSTAINLAARSKVDLESMVTHTFPLEDYRKMIDVNMNKGKYRAIKTAVAFS